MAEPPPLVLPRARSTAARWSLILLFVLWANLDAWSLLGPVLVGLYSLGEGIIR